MREKFGEKVYKLALEGGFTCPNRDGTLGTKGCIFCLGGSGDFAEKPCENIFLQIEKAKARVAAKNPSGKYIAYFQSYTNTYGPIEKMRALFTEAISHPDVVALSIGTRPDCLPDEALELLSELNKIKPVWVELGLQTVHEKTAKYIRRGYPLCVFDSAVKRLKKAGIYVIVHMIIGLPGETSEMIAKTAEYIGKSGADGIKLQLLHVLEGTDLAEDYVSGKFKTLELEEYISVLEECIRRIPPEMTVHRLTGDGSKKHLVAPLWSADKKRVLNAINAAFRKDNLEQGSAL
ncbi:MAG: TIGR01212 family radical SAM protein [Oscillospiraceae bacterium]|nr:TIGR01212 family radical SAM protein [Oscillospiraceae bacterium]MBQ6699896.1 TIGR01212 family radical SAM protein [Oscillospiraceae bacterium]